MPRRGAIIFSALIGKLDAMRVTCEPVRVQGVLSVTELDCGVWPQCKCSRLAG
jgi:hypothetical protein